MGRMCYAKRTEIRPDRSELAAKLQRHFHRGAADVTLQAIGELEKRGQLPWLRLSTNGSVPQEPDEQFADALHRLMAKARELATPVHFPVESPEKAERYREVVDGLCVVRESTHTLERWTTARVLAPSWPEPRI